MSAKVVVKLTAFAAALTAIALVRQAAEFAEQHPERPQHDLWHKLRVIMRRYDARLAPPSSAERILNKIFGEPYGGPYVSPEILKDAAYKPYWPMLDCFRSRDGNPRYTTRSIFAVRGGRRIYVGELPEPKRSLEQQVIDASYRAYLLDLSSLSTARCESFAQWLERQRQKLALQKFSLRVGTCLYGVTCNDLRNEFASGGIVSGKMQYIVGE